MSTSGLELAILGGAPILSEPLSVFHGSLGLIERSAVERVMDSGSLSAFYGSAGPEFFGGEEVRALEAEWSEYFGMRHAVSVNAATSGLIAAMGAIGVSPGDEVIVPPYTMSATAMAPLFYGGIPVFADIEDQTFCLDPAAVEAAINIRTRAIIAVNLFGHPAQISALRAIAEKHRIYLIEDNAQAPLGREGEHLCGTVGHVGIFSLNYHKHIHSGEGGICVTDDDTLANRLRMIRNHAENVADEMGAGDYSNLIGHNFRMSELSAAIARAQLARAEELVRPREHIAESLTDAIDDLEGLTAPKVRPDCRHNYYCWTLRYDSELMGVSRETFSRALTEEGFPHSVGYVEPLYLLPVFRERQAIGRDGFPFNLTNRHYEAGLCPVAERMHFEEVILFEPCAYDVSEDQLEKLANALRKVHKCRVDLRVIDSNE